MGHINTETPGGLKVYFVLLDEKYSKVGFNFFRLDFFVAMYSVTQKTNKGGSC